ncbi:hypothetical protein HUG15_06615 [Salicibibacter cibarius]|uniref:HAAS transmembrane region domain-containing protein n=1 Tax=Salicibibacter cibarius TaxID=2743000 RepID=A0A7T6Z1N1_9BACI|nr:hypothetical protein [Salicibibacter cibarius]QQK75294.1 hypothetical protein HUG15_06615 [Salicibibacter cibarius]
MQHVSLSRTSKKFIEDLRVYLFTNGKSHEEVDDIIQELSDHLYDAEQNGKSVKEVVGNSPKEYMDNISTEINNDFKSWWLKYIPMIILGAISFPVINDIIQGEVSYSVLHIIAYFLFSLVFISGVFIVFKYSAKNQLSKTKEVLLAAIPVSISTLLFIGILTMDNAMNAPIVDFGFWGQVVLIALMTIFIIGFSVWAKTAILPVILIVWSLLPHLLSYTSLGESLQSTINIILGLFIIGLYLVFGFKDDEK